MHKKILKHLKLQISVFGTCIRALRMLFPLHIAFKFALSTIPLVVIYVFSVILELLSVSTIDIEKTVLYAILFVVLTALGKALEMLNGILESKINLRIKQHTHIEFNRLVTSFPLSYIDSPKGRNDIQLLAVSYEFYGNIYHGTLNILSHIYSFAASLCLVASFHYVYALIIVALSLPVILYSYKNQKEDNDLEAQMQPLGAVKDNYLNMLTASPYAMDVRLYNIQTVFKEKYISLAREIKQLLKGKYKARLTTGCVFEIVLLSGQAALICHLIFRAWKGFLSISKLSELTGYVAAAITNMVSCGAVITDVITKLLWIDEYSVSKRDMDARSEASDGKECIEMLESIEFSDVWFKYPGTETYVLKGVSFCLNKGEKLSIVGVNGAGKTTCIKLLLGIYKPDKGQILLNHLPMERLSPKRLRKLFSCVFQNYIIYPFSLRDNVKFGSKDESADGTKLKETAKQSGCCKFLDSFEHGYDTVLSRKFDSDGVELSKGQKQSVVIARALYKNAQVMIFDEPSSALDAENEHELLKVFDNLSPEQFGILISHRLSSTSVSDKIILLDGGFIKESGTHKELMDLNGLYAQMYTKQKEQFEV